MSAKKNEDRLKKIEAENKELKKQLEEANHILHLFKHRDPRFQSDCWDKLNEYLRKYKNY